MAVDAVPPHLWKKTPVVLKATAGLRLLSEEKAQALLSEVVLHCFGCTNIVLPVMFFCFCFLKYYFIQFSVLFSIREFDL